MSFPLATTQPEWSCLQHSALRDGTLDLCMEQSITPLGWSPLGGGRLAWSDAQISQAIDQGQLTKEAAQNLRTTVSILDQLAEVKEVSRAATAIAWTMQHPAGVIPIIGTQNLDRMKDCVSAQTVSLSKEEWNSVLVAAQGYPLP